MFFKRKNHRDVVAPSVTNADDASRKLNALLKEHAAKVYTLSTELRRQKQELANYRRRFVREDEFVFDSYPVQKACDDLNQFLNYEAIATRLGEICRELRGIDYAGVFLQIDKQWNCQITGNPPFYEKLFRQLQDSALLTEISNQRDAQVLPATVCKDLPPQEDREVGCLLLIPMVLGEQFWGMLVVFSSLTEQAAGGAYLGQLNILATQAAAALRYTYVYKDLESTHSELTRSQSLLIRASRLAATGEVAGGIAHEINNPLQVILGKIQISRLKKDFEDALNDIEPHVMRIATIVKGLQSVSADSVSSRSKEIADLNQVVLYCLNLIRGQLNRRNIKVESTPGEKVPFLPISPATLRQVVLSFLIQAKKRLESGGELSLATEKDDEYVILRILDNGDAYPEALVQQLSDPLAIPSKSGEMEEHFGIIICAHLLRDAGGRVDMKVRPGLNSVELFFPLHAVEKQTVHKDVNNGIFSTS